MGGFLEGCDLKLSFRFEVNVEFFVGVGWFLENLVSGFKEDIFGVVEVDVRNWIGLGIDGIVVE